MLTSHVLLCVPEDSDTWIAFEADRQSNFEFLLLLLAFFFTLCKRDAMGTNTV